MLSLALLAIACLDLVVGQQNYATWLNWGTNDLLDGQNGMPPSAIQPWKYGQPLYPVTTEGNGREQVEGHLSYYAGKYYLYAATWGCGTVNVFSSIPSDQPSASRPSPYQAPGDYGKAEDE